MTKHKKPPRDEITRPMTAAFLMFGLIAYNLAIRFSRLLDSAPGIVLLVTASLLAAAGCLLCLVMNKKLTHTHKEPSSLRELLYLLLAFAETAVLVAFLYGVEGK